jgi:hypothetical protein
LQKQSQLRNKVALMSESGCLLLFTDIWTDNKISENPIGSTLPRFNTNQIVTNTSGAFAEHKLMAFYYTKLEETFRTWTKNIHNFVHRLQNNWYEIIWSDMRWHYVVRYYVMWYDMTCGTILYVIYDIMWYDIIWCDMIWLYVVRYYMMWYDMTLCGTILYDTWHDKTRHDIMWYDTWHIWHLEADQWLNRKEWCLGSGRLRQLHKTGKIDRQTWHDVWYDMIWYMTWHDIIYEMTWYVFVWYMTWHGIIWYYIVWYDI